MQTTFRQNVFRQYRLLKYIRDILNNWLIDPSNIQDQRLVYQLYKNNKLRKQNIRVGVAFDANNNFIGATPSILINIGKTTYQRANLNYVANPQFYNNPTQSPILHILHKTVPVIVSVITQGYQMNLVLTQLIQNFLASNIHTIQQDCAMLDKVDFTQVSQPKPIKVGQIANAKQLYKSDIVLTVYGHVTWSIATQGPVFQGVSYKTN